MTIHLPLYPVVLLRLLSMVNHPPSLRCLPRGIWGPEIWLSGTRSLDRCSTPCQEANRKSMMGMALVEAALPSFICLFDLRRNVLREQK